MRANRKTPHKNAPPKPSWLMLDGGFLYGNTEKCSVQVRSNTHNANTYKNARDVKYSRHTYSSQNCCDQSAVADDQLTHTRATLTHLTKLLWQNRHGAMLSTKSRTRSPNPCTAAAQDAHFLGKLTQYGWSSCGCRYACTSAHKSLWTWSMWHWYCGAWLHSSRYLSVCVYVCIYVCIHIHIIDICMHTQGYVCMYVRMYVCMHIAWQAMGWSYSCGCFSGYIYVHIRYVFMRMFQWVYIYMCI